MIPFQITAMRKKVGWSQQQLAEASGLSQGVISRAEDPTYGNLTFNTILRIAAGFDVAFIGEFISFSQLVKRVENLSEQSVQVATFEQDVRPQQDPVDIAGRTMTVYSQAATGKSLVAAYLHSICEENVGAPQIQKMLAQQLITATPVPRLLSPEAPEEAKIDLVLYSKLRQTPPYYAVPGGNPSSVGPAEPHIGGM
jgi:transcriptional regulator with XRE-family HTH domain